MSVMDYGVSRRYSPHTDLSFPNYYYPERNTPLELSQAIRVDPRGYHLVGPVGGARGRPAIERGESMIGNGSSRRRIAVACARCRKRKIRCSGDPGNGTGCNSCKVAGVELGSCQFHRVGSDSVHKVMDNIQVAQSLTGMAHSNRMLPIYSAATPNAMHSRPMTSQTYPQLDAKTAYPSPWNVPYSEETTPVETYGLEQPAACMANPMPIPIPIANTNIYSSSCRWSHPTTRAFQEAPDAYYDQEPSYTTNELPCGLSDSMRNTEPSGPISPLNLSSLRMNLPERPHPRHQPGAEGLVPRRQLPFPQPPNAVQTSRRNVLDDLQGLRLRCSQVASASSTGISSASMKPLLPWSSTHNNQINVSAVTSSGPSAQLSTAANGALDFLATAAIEGDTGATGTASQLQLNYSSSQLFSALTTPAPSTPYSTFREDRTQSQISTHMARHDSETNLYSFNPDSAAKCKSPSRESSDDYKLVNGRSYMPLKHRSQHSPVVTESLQYESLENRQTSLHRASMVNLSASF